MECVETSFARRIFSLISCFHGISNTYQLPLREWHLGIELMAAKYSQLLGKAKQTVEKQIVSALSHFLSLSLSTLC